jgi:hypothetical protein
LNADNLYRFPELISEITNRERLDTEKGLMFLNDHFSERISRGFPLRAILLPHVTAHKETTVRKISGAVSLKALASSTMSQLPGANAKTFQTLAEIVKQVPSYRLDAGSDISQIPTVIARLLAEDC